MIRNTCTLSTVLLQFTCSLHVRNCLFGFRGIILISGYRNYLPPIRIDSTWKFRAMVYCAVNTWLKAGTRLFMVQTTWHTKPKCMTNFLEYRSKHCTHRGIHSDGQPCNFVACSILSFFVLRQCAAYISGRRTVTLGLRCVCASTQGNKTGKVSRR